MTDNVCNSREKRETFSENNTKNHIACKTHAELPKKMAPKDVPYLAISYFCSTQI